MMSIQDSYKNFATKTYQDLDKNSQQYKTMELVWFAAWLVALTDIKRLGAEDQYTAPRTLEALEDEAFSFMKMKVEEISREGRL